MGGLFESLSGASALRAEGKSAQNIANFNAAVARQTGVAAKAKAKFGQKRQAESAARTKSALIAKIAAAGGLDSPVTGDIIAEQAAELELENLLIGFEGEVLAQQVENRFDDECWEWPAAHTPNGYGVLYYKGKVVKAHRLAYKLRYVPVPIGLDLDHLCFNKGCWNPSHLEPVTRKENLRRDPNGNGQKTECPRGHPYNLENTHY
ncbi:hypothetical protein LCGC14_2689350, partial [marine sediment metagenome]